MTRNGMVFVTVLALLSCAGWLRAPARAGNDAATKKLVEYYRRKANVPPSAQVQVKNLRASKIKGAKYGTLAVGGRNVDFLLSTDGRYAVFGELEDLNVDPFAAVMKKISLKGKPQKGPADAKVTIVEYSDFQCPYCSRGYHTMENQVLKEYGDKVRFVYKNFPLPMHPWAQSAAVASECALQQKQEAFWKLYDFYFQNQRKITLQNLKEKSLAALDGAGLDATKFTDCVDNNRTLDQVKADQAEGARVGVRGTPAFIINGRLVSGAQPFTNFKAVIDDELARADKSS
ncbi:MAG: DsbA family protein [Candidatus Binatia bacterium]